MITASERVALPPVIQGGMGVGVSNWMLARAVAQRGQLGVVSGTALDTVFVRRLQDGDPGDHMRRAIDHFPIPQVGADALKRYFLDGGRAPGQPYKMLPMYKQVVSVARQQITMLANFVEVYLAKEGHDGVVGVNLLTKVQLPNLASLCGAMLAGVDYVLMGAGIPREIPGVLDAFAEHRTASIRFDVEGVPSAEPEYLTFDPQAHGVGLDIPMKRPRFIAIVAASSLAATLARKANGRVDGFVVEGPTAGGHNAPPRGKLQLDERGEAIYGERDAVDLEKIMALGVPFWLAGGYGSPEKLAEALNAGATGVQVGTAFAFCDESGLKNDYKRALLEKVRSGTARVFTDSVASPTSFPFKVAQLEGSLSEDQVYSARPRICDLGYLREAYRTPSGAIDYRCSAEPVTTYLSKGGRLEDTSGKKCLCNALLANIGHPQVRNGKYTEQALITSGNDLVGVDRFLRPGASTYSAADVIAKLITGVGSRVRSSGDASHPRPACARDLSHC